MQIDPDALPNDPTALQQMLRELYAENDKLRLLLERLTRYQFGRRSEQLTADQLQLGLEDQEQIAAEHEASQDARAKDPATRSRSTRPARNHGALPSHLPHYQVVIDVAHEACPCCGGKMHCIGELRTEQLDIVPAHRRPDTSLPSVQHTAQPCRNVLTARRLLGNATISDIRSVCCPTTWLCRNTG